MYAHVKDLLDDFALFQKWAKAAVDTRSSILKTTARMHMEKRVEAYTVYSN